jgi:hypothetical protein
MRLLPLAALLVGCAPSEFGLSPVEAGPDLDALSWQRIEVPAEGSALEAAVDLETGLHRDVFAVGPQATSDRQDLLFVIDDSHSMRRLRDQVVAGLGSLSDGSAFPARARIAVTNMTPADPEKKGRKPHPLARKHKRLKHHPGFQRLVSDRSLQRWTEGAVTGCDSWFGPTDVTADGDPCFAVHSALSLGRYRSEDGLVALAQLLERRGERGLFRQGAVVNVVFVSDTQPPGYVPHDADELRWQAFEDLDALRPDWPELQALVAEHHELAGLRVHAIAPETSCGEDWEGLDTLYQDVAVASGGVVADVCITTDYAAVMAEIQRTSAAVAEPMLVLGGTPDEVLSVTVGGEPVSWTQEDDRILVDALELAPGSQAVIIYR